MVCNIIGYSHLTDGKNCQDSYCQSRKVKIITDGCSSCKNSEVGAKLFTQVFMEIPNKEDPVSFTANVDLAMRQLLRAVAFEGTCEPSSQQVRLMNDNFSFTIIALFETDSEFIVKMLGDGTIITKNTLGEISYIEIDQNNQPSYAIYQYIPKEYIEEGFTFDTEPRTYTFSKKCFRDVGIASDGIKGRQNLNSDTRAQFDIALMAKGLGKVKTIIKNNHSSFPDDITLIMSAFEEAL